MYRRQEGTGVRETDRSDGELTVHNEHGPLRRRAGHKPVVGNAVEHSNICSGNIEDGEERSSCFFVSASFECCSASGHVETFPFPVDSVCNKKSQCTGQWRIQQQRLLHSYLVLPLLHPSRVTMGFEAHSPVCPSAARGLVACQPTTSSRRPATTLAGPGRGLATTTTSTPKTLGWEGMLQDTKYLPLQPPAPTRSHSNSTTDGGGLGLTRLLTNRPLQ